MHLELLDDKARDFPAIADPGSYSSALVWRCRYRTLAPIAQFAGLRSLKILVFPDTTFDVLAGLSQLEELEVTHLPHVPDLEALAQLRRLRRLHLATLPSWDSSGKVTEVDSLAPLVRLDGLQELWLFGVRPRSKSVDDILAMKSLQVARVHKYPKPEAQRLEQEMERRRRLAADDGAS
jgi:hypothetical protein